MARQRPGLIRRPKDRPCLNIDRIVMAESESSTAVDIQASDVTASEAFSLSSLSLMMMLY